MSALRTLLAAMPDILAAVEGTTVDMRERVFDTLVNAALTDAGMANWNYSQPQHYTGVHGETSLLPRVDGSYDPRVPRNGG